MLSRSSGPHGGHNCARQQDERDPAGAQDPCVNGLDPHTLLIVEIGWVAITR